MFIVTPHGPTLALVQDGQSGTYRVAETHYEEDGIGLLWVSDDIADREEATLHLLTLAAEAVTDDAPPEPEIPNGKGKDVIEGTVLDD